MDSTDVEVYRRGVQGVAGNYKGQRGGRPTWRAAEAEETLAAKLLAGNDDLRPRAVGLLDRGGGRAAVSATPRARRPPDAGPQDRR